MAAYKIVRFTGDADLLVVDEAVLSPTFWHDFQAELRVAYGDSDDPFAGAVELTRPDQIRVDVLVGRMAWQTRILQRVMWRRLGGVRVPVLQLPDLILTKLFAGGVQDRADVHFLLSALTPRERRQLAARLPVLPEEARQLYRELRVEKTWGGRRRFPARE